MCLPGGDQRGGKGGLEAASRRVGSGRRREFGAESVPAVPTAPGLNHLGLPNLPIGGLVDPIVALSTLPLSFMAGRGGIWLRTGSDLNACLEAGALDRGRMTLPAVQRAQHGVSGRWERPLQRRPADRRAGQQGRLLGDGPRDQSLLLVDMSHPRAAGRHGRGRRGLLRRPVAVGLRGRGRPGDLLRPVHRAPLAHGPFEPLPRSLGSVLYVDNVRGSRFTAGWHFALAAVTILVTRGCSSWSVGCI